jgi:transposase
MMENTENKGNGTRKRYTKEFKLEAVQMLEAGGKAGTQIERDLGIGSGQVYKWRKELASQGQQAFPGNGNPRDEELVKLRKECANLREERDILRKAVAIFSKPSR